MKQKPTPEDLGGEVSDQSDGNSPSELQLHNKSYARKLTRLAWGIELTLVSVALAVAFAQAQNMPVGSGLYDMVPVFGVFLVLAAAELAKIPAATVVFHARKWARVFAATGLMFAAFISFETIFNGFERYVHFTTEPVAEAEAELRELRGEIDQLTSTPLEDELDGSKIDAADDKQLQRLKEALVLREDILKTAKSDLESSETKEFRSQLDKVLKQQNDAGNAAQDAWQSEQDSIMTRLNGTAIDAQTRAQLNARMRGMPAKQSVITEARVKFDAEINKLNAQIEASITEPDPGALAAVTKAQTERDAAAKQLSDYEAEVNARAADRIEVLQNAEAAAAERALKIESLQAEAVKQEAKVDAVSNASQMHRWASFIFGKEPREVSEDEAKQVGAVFGLLLGVVGALTGISVALYGEWFRVRGVQPVIEKIEVPVEIEVEKEVEKIVEVEVPTLKYTYVPVPVGEDVQDAIDAILSALPEDAAAELQSQLAQSHKISPVEEVRYENAA